MLTNRQMRGGLKPKSESVRRAEWLMEHITVGEPQYTILKPAELEKIAARFNATIVMRKVRPTNYERGYCGVYWSKC